MNFKRKRNIKKLAKIYATIQWLFVIIFAVTFSVIFIQGSSVLFWVMAIPSMLLSFTFNILSIFCSNKRTNYLSNIEKYKQWMYFNTILDLLKEENCDDAIHIYNYCLKKGKLKDFLYGYIICAEQRSIDKNRKQNGDENFNKFRNQVKAEDVKF